MISCETWVSFTIAGCFRPGKMHPGCVLPAPDWITTNSALVRDRQLCKHASVRENTQDSLSWHARNIIDLRRIHIRRSQCPGLNMKELPTGSDYPYYVHVLHHFPSTEYENNTVHVLPLHPALFSRQHISCQIYQILSWWTKTFVLLHQYLKYSHKSGTIHSILQKLLSVMGHCGLCKGSPRGTFSIHVMSDTMCSQCLKGLTLYQTKCPTNQPT